jgi:hypothetical protein
MAQGYKKTLRQGSPPDKSKQYDQSPDSYYPGSIKREVYLDFEHWQNIAESSRPWYEYNHSAADRERVVAIQRRYHRQKYCLSGDMDGW